MPDATAPTHVYRHPSGASFGEHHALQAGRKAPDRAALAALGVSDDDITVLAEHHDRMRALDLADGTEVTHCGANDDDSGTIRVEWTDAEGTPRATSVDAALFASHFTPIPTEG